MSIAIERLCVAVLVVALCSVSLSCASAPNVRDGTRYRPGALRHQALLILPLATSSELRDDRTGIVLRNDSLIHSYKAMCEKTRELLDGSRVQCAYDQTAVRGLPELRALMQDFAYDRPPQRVLLAALAERTGARYVLLFRPESVSAARHSQSAADQTELVQSTVNRNLPQTSSFATALGQSVGYGLGMLIVGALGSDGNGVTSSRSYTVSAVLLDLLRGDAARYGVHSAVGSKTGKGYPEPAPILADAMLELAVAMADD